MANFGYYPLTFDVLQNTENKDLKACILRLKEVQQTLFNILNHAIQTYKNFADRKQTPGPAITKDSWVLLNAKNLKFKLGVKKLSP